MKKYLLFLIFIPLLVSGHIKDERLFKTVNVPSAAMLLLDRSGSMNSRTYHYEAIVRLKEYSWWDNSEHLSGWYDSTLTPDGPGDMKDFNKLDADGDWILQVQWSDWGWNRVQLSWTLKIKSYGSWHTYNGGSYTWDGWWFEERRPTINVLGLGEVDDVQCYVNITTDWGLKIGEMRINLIKTPLDAPFESTRIKDALLVIHSLLDADNNGFVTREDEDYLTIRMGQGCHRENKTGDVFIPKSAYEYYSDGDLGESYDEVLKKWKNVGGGNVYSDTIGSHFTSIWNHINYTDNGGWTPNGVLIARATDYVESWQTDNPELWCMNHNLVIITDGESNQPREDCGEGSRDIVRQAYKAWRSDSIRVYAVGFGEGISERGANELNWTAYHGGTQSKDSAFIDSMVRIEGMDTTAIHASSCSMDDPQNHFLTGYAFIAKDLDELASVLALIFMEIAGQKNQSYAAGEVTSVEEEFLTTEYKARLFFASFIPDTMPIWRGDLRAVKLDTGEFNLDSIPPDLLIWTANDSLQIDHTADSRNIYGIKPDGNVYTFDSTNFDYDDLGVATPTEAREIIDLIRDGLTDDNLGELGDIFHSSPLRIHAPNYFYVDQGFNQYYDNMKDRSAIIYAGANDGMIHVFADSISGEGGRGGEELECYIPMNFIKKLRRMQNEHNYFVDANPIAADVWLPENTDDSLKDWDEWHTVLIACQGEGGRSFTALDITDPLNETAHSKTSIEFLFSAWQDSILKDTLGYTTSTPVINKIGVDWTGHANRNIDRFFAFMGGGQWPDPMDISLLDSVFGAGKIKGNVILAFDVWDVVENGISNNYHIIPPTSSDISYFLYPFVATPALININPEMGNRYDFMFLPDAAGQLWFVDLRKPNPVNWEAERIFIPELPTSADSTELTDWHPAYYRPLVWQDPVYNGYWIAYGTGNRSNIFAPSEERFYAIYYPDSVLEDTTISIPVYEEGDLGTPGSPTDNGWLFGLQHTNEKVVTQPIYYLDSLTFFTFSPGLDTTLSPCDIGGAGSVARSYTFDIRSGGTDIIGGTPEGTGIPQPPRYSYSLGGKGMKITQVGGQIKIERSRSFKSYKQIIKWKEE